MNWKSLRPLLLAAFALLAVSGNLRAQASPPLMLMVHATPLTIAPALLGRGDSIAAVRVGQGLQSLFDQLRAGKIDSLIAGGEDSAVSVHVYSSFDSVLLGSAAHMINFYSLGDRKYMCCVAFGGSDLIAIVNFVADISGAKVRVGVPLSWDTRDWKRRQIGTVEYRYIGGLNARVAGEFERKNRGVAARLGIRPVRIRMYLTSNYQEIMRLFGYEYDSRSVGLIRNGYYIDSNIVFAVQGSEDFSHDVVHFYSSRFRGNVKRNAAADEGLAYLWGNAYYTDEHGQMISLDTLAGDLREYFNAHPGVSVRELFSSNPKILTKRAKEVSVKSVISGILLAEVERRKGVAGIKQVLLCGPGDAAFLSTIDVLLGINEGNFDMRVRRLITHSDL